MDTKRSFSGLQIICQIVCKSENFLHSAKRPRYEFERYSVSQDMFAQEMMLGDKDLLSFLFTNNMKIFFGAISQWFNGALQEIKSINKYLP